jgi:hypothetical protein
MGVEGHTRALSEGTNLLKRSVKVCAGFGVDRDDVRASIGKRLNIFIWFDDHEVDVHDALGGGAYGFYDERANRDVRHESAIHDVDVDPIGACVTDCLDFSLKAAKISRKHGGGNSERLWGAGHGRSQAPPEQHVNGIRSLTAIVPAKDNGKTPRGRADERG